MFRYFLLPVFWAAISAMQACPASGVEPDSLIPDSLRREADILFARQDYDQAAGIYRKVLEADSLDTRAMALLGSCLMRTGQPGQAVGIFTRAIDLDPMLKLAYLGLVYSYYRLAQFDSSRIWADSCRLFLVGSQRDVWDRMLREFFPLIFRTEVE